jgi:subtilase family serine protease
MPRSVGLSLAVAVALAVGALVVPATVTAGTALASPGASSAHRHQRVCPAATGHLASCHAIVDLDAVTPNAAGATPGGYGPADLQAAYSLPSTTAGSGPTVAVVDAYDLPTAQSDLNTYRAQYGLPACGTGCFSKVSQTGSATALPPANASWGQEIALDLDMVSAACPNCKILLVEASSTQLSDLGTAVNTAVKLGAVAVSNSYGGSEAAQDTTYDTSYYNHPGVAITASSGDSGYGVQYPAASQYVTAVGGTSLNRDTTTARGFTEAAWSGAGSGCSAYDPKPVWQHDTGCTRRTVADVSAVADPNTGVAVYDSTPSGTQSGWLVFGGTSVAAPLVAGIYALGGSPTSSPASLPYNNPTALQDVATGSNGACGTYLCNAVTGYDGPTGLGTPHGTTAFKAGTTTPPPAPVTQQLLGNPGFETGTAAPWSVTAGVIDNSTGQPAHAGSWKAWLDGYGSTHTDTLAQTITIPAGTTSASLAYWLHIDTAETTTTRGNDTLTLQLLNSAGSVLSTPARYSKLNRAAGYTQHTLDLSAYRGQTITLKFTGTENSTAQTSFVLDDITLTTK